ncbi:MAG: Fe-S oxidoreductase, partial [Calditrichaeota bacterium]
MPDVTTPTREVFRNFPFLMQLIFYVVGFSAIGVFLHGFYRRIQKYRKGRPAGRFNHLGQRFLKAFRIMLTNATVFKRDAYAGAAHWMIF